MRFGTFLLRVDNRQEASLDDLKRVCEIGLKRFQPLGQKNLYMIDTDIIDDRYFWLSCDYDDAVIFKDYVVNQETGETEPNPRSKNQVELKKQFFVCYDTQSHFLYICDLGRRATLTAYLSDSIQKNFSIKNVYASVDEFCERIKSIRGFKYTQVNNIFGRASDIFQQVGDIWGLDLPSKVQLKVGYDDIPVHEGRALIDRFHRKREEFQEVIVIGVDDEGVEQTFDFSSVIKRIDISPIKDENEQYDPREVRELLLAELRK